MPGIRAQKKRQTRQAIVTAAVRLFAEKGFDHTSMEELAKEAGVGKATIYGYFSTKSEIFLAFCEEEIDFAFDRVATQSDPAAPLLDQLMALHMGQFDFITANREFGRIFCREMLFPAEQQIEASRELDAHYVQHVTILLERARQRGELRSDVQPLLALGHFHALYQIVLSSWYCGRILNRDEVEASLQALFIQALTGLGTVPIAAQIDQGRLDVIQQRFHTASPANGD